MFSNTLVDPQPSVITFMLLFSLMLCTSTRLQAQTVISSAGNESFTLGEVAISSYSIGDAVVTEGFHQPDLITTNMVEFQNSIFEVSLFPNPTNRFAVIQSEAQLLENVRHVEIVNLLGQRQRLSFENQRTIIELDLRDFSPGYYQILAMDSSQSLLFNASIIKN